MAGCDIKLIFQQSETALNSEFTFSNSKKKKTVFPTVNP